ncbi:hypothetical protein [Lachnotalea sp. AF33-28]|jgi:hypothetical protein|uniref:hypothetical protein n=1 Tax=Lachnotalea sp. AF33-28 TaxID=2292046 RepID=UPI000E4FAE15|nr:hypothetical protein [Lachnotalea sp. AF33-28]RHP32053.1 hypothetical protein DWZ56_14945 [Lachnotalea sp. AF33-28]
MTAILESLHKFERGFDERVQRFALYHPCLALFAAFAGIPIFLLGAVAVCTALITLPLALIFGFPFI